jgi:hypothetical protein
MGYGLSNPWPEWANNIARWLRRKAIEMPTPGPRLRLMPEDLHAIRRRVDASETGRLGIISRVKIYALLTEVEWWRRHYGPPPPHPQGYGIDMRDAPDNIDFRRADGRVVCEKCGKPYNKHPHTEHRDFNGDPWLRELCDGSLVKL